MSTNNLNLKSVVTVHLGLQSVHVVSTIRKCSMNRVLQDKVKLFTAVHQKLDLIVMHEYREEVMYKMLHEFQ